MEVGKAVRGMLQKLGRTSVTMGTWRHEIDRWALVNLYSPFCCGKIIAKKLDQAQKEETPAK